MWYDSGATGEFDLPIGAVVKQADAGQIVIVTDEGEVRIWYWGWSFAKGKHTGWWERLRHRGGMKKSRRGQFIYLYIYNDNGLLFLYFSFYRPIFFILSLVIGTLSIVLHVKVFLSFILHCASTGKMDSHKRFSQAQSHAPQLHRGCWRHGGCTCPGRTDVMMAILAWVCLSLSVCLPVSPSLCLSVCLSLSIYLYKVIAGFSPNGLQCH